MSKYKSYGKSKANARAGLQFDKLLKACSNSKKPQTAMAAGAVGRFGVAEFTSTRSCFDSVEVEQVQEKPSRFSSLNKRARLEPQEANKSVVGSSSILPISPNDPFMTSHIPITVLKPRKFFKSRGPIEVEIDRTRPLRPDVTNLVPAPFNSNPILGSNQSNINNSTHSSSNYYQNNSTTNSYNHHQDNKKGETLKNTTNVSPSAKSSDKDNFSTVCSPPIKLRIIKDKATSKFMSVADATPSPHAEVPPSFPLFKGGHDSPSGKGKKKELKEKKREKKLLKKLDNAVEIKEKSPKQVKVKQLKLKVEKPPKLVKPKKVVPKRTSGRITRSSAKSQDDDSQPEDSSDPVTAISVEQENLSIGRDISLDNLSNQQGQTKKHHHPEETLRKLEEDAEFQKLSQMLSSMEEENSSSSQQQQQDMSRMSEMSENSYFDNSGRSSEQQQSQQFSQQQSSFSSSQNSYPVNLTCGSGSGSDSESSYQSQSFSNLNPNPYFHCPAPNLPGTSSSSTSRHDNFQYNSSSSTSNTQQNHGPLMQESKVQDIRSILEDDWNESYEEESPRKNNTHGGGHNQSPPKVSRFDASAFMSQQNQHHQQQQSPPINTTSHNIDDYNNKRDFPENIQRPIPVYGTQFPTNPQQQQQQHPFNINSSPYAMRNLLSCPEGEGKAALGYSEGDISDEPQNLVCPKIESKKETESSSQEFLSSQSQEYESQSQGQDYSSQNNTLMSSSQQSTSSGISSLSQPPSQQQVTNPKKASIFKSRGAKGGNGDGNIGNGTGEVKKRLALYKHTFGQQDKPDEQSGGTASKPAGTIYGDYDDFGDEEEGDDSDLKLRKLRIANSSTGYSSELVGEGDGVNKVLCKKEAKKLFTVVRNVKAGHELQESGEFHEFDGDVWYILEDLKDKNPMNSRCLSAITLAGRCMDQAFRMHLRAHGTVAEFCKELHDAPQHPVLSLLAATVLFVLSQDRLNMDLDTESLKLILALTKSEAANEQEEDESSETTKNRQRVTHLCSEMKNRGHAKHLKLDKITASELALETLLYLTSKRAGEWVKHELRTLGGLDSIVGEVETSFNRVKKEIMVEGEWSENVMERLRKIDRCLQVLQQVTFNHEDNQRYLMQVSTREVNGDSVKCTEASPIVFLEMFQFCKEILQQIHAQLEVSAVIREILFSVLRLLVNLSHDYRGIVLGSEIMMGMDGFLELALHSTFQMTTHFPDEKVFDLLMHSLCLLLNVVEYSKTNRNRILQSTIRKNSSGSFTVSLNDSDDSGVEEDLPALDALIQMFMSRERSAKKEEQHTDNILTTGTNDRSQGSSGTSTQKDSNSQEKDKDTEGTSVQDTIDKLIQTAGRHMENSLIAAYISLLIAYLIMDDQPSVEQVRNSMPDRKFLPLMVVLKKLFNFMSITSSASGSTRGLKATAIALKFYGKADPKSDEELKKIIPD